MTQNAQHAGSAVPADALADRKTVVRLLNGALANEIVCVLRYRKHHFMARRIHSESVARELLAYANEEQRHADLIAARITQLGGTLVFSPDGLLTSDHSDDAEPRRDLIGMIRDDLMAEHLGIEAYGEMIRYFGDDDRTSRRLLEEILVNEKQHAGDLAALIEVLRGEERGAFFAARGPNGVHAHGPTPARPLEIAADRPRRVDSWIDYFGER
jgi:bacterioferritin